MASTRIRPMIPIVGTLMILIATGFGLAGYLSSQMAERDQNRMVAMAANLNDPAGLVVTDRIQCSDNTHVVRCLEGEQDPDTLAAAYQLALSAAAGRAAGLHCETLRIKDRQPRSCLVRVDDGEHAVLISIDSRPVHPAAGLALSGSHVRIEAD